MSKRLEPSGTPVGIEQKADAGARVVGASGLSVDGAKTASTTVAPSKLSALQQVAIGAGALVWGVIVVAAILSNNKHQAMAPKPNPQTAVTTVPTDPASSGRPTYKASDFNWPDDSGPQQGAVVQIANRIMDQRPECLALNVRNITLIGPAERGTFALECKTTGELIPFEFRAADAASGRSFAPVKPLDIVSAAEACKSAILARATHPSTVEFPMLDYDLLDKGEGRTELRMSFAAKNGFGLELQHDAECDFEGDTLTSVSMSEAGR